MCLIIHFSVYSQSSEPVNNLGKSLTLMSQEFPELRFNKTDEKGDQYVNGLPQNGIAVFFYFKNNYVVEECMICEAKDGFPFEWFKSMVNAFDKNYFYAGRNTKYGKEYVFSTFSVNLIYISENGTNTALIVYAPRNNTSNRINSVTQPVYSQPSQKRGKIEWYEINYTENQSDVNGLQSVGFFAASSNPVFFGSRSYDEAFRSALRKLQKRAAKKGARILLITYKSALKWDFLTVRVNAIGYK